MSETQIDTPQSEMRSEVSTSDDDNALQAIWDKNNSPEVLQKNPLMPDVPVGDDIFKASYDWNQLPLKERQMTSAVHREFADLKKQGEALGMKTETAADMKAIQDMLAVKNEAPVVAKPDPEIQSSLQTFKGLVPHAKDHKEASQFLNGWVEAIGRDPEKGWRSLLEAQGMGHLLRDGAAPQAQPATEDSGVAAWAAKRGVSVEDQRAMGDIVSEPSWREIAGESLSSTLDRAHKALQRRGRQNSTGRQNRDLDATLRATAADIYRD